MALKITSSKPAAAKPGAAKKAKLSVMLGNRCQRYVFDGKLYLAGAEYEVTAEERRKLFQVADDNGVRYFYDAEFVKKREEARRRRDRQQQAARDGDIGEIDTASRVLTDETGNPMGDDEGGSGTEDEGDVVHV